MAIKTLPAPRVRKAAAGGRMVASNQSKRRRINGGSPLEMDAPVGDSMGGVVVRALAASREAVEAAEALAASWVSPKGVGGEIPSATASLATRLGEAHSLARVLCDHLGQASALAQVLQDSVAKDLPVKDLPVTGTAKPEKVLPQDSSPSSEELCRPEVAPKLVLNGGKKQQPSPGGGKKQQLSPKLVRQPALRLANCDLSEWRANELLEHVAKSGRKLQDKDVLRVLETWKFKPNTKRQNVMREGVKVVSSEMLGLIRVRVYSKFVVAQRSLKYPNVTRLLSQYFKDHPPPGQAPGVQFPFSTVCINRDYAAKRHRDVNNVGLSVVRALGNFSGGKLRYFPKDTGHGDVNLLDEADSVLLNVQSRTVCMRSTLAHEVEAFKGTRYSLVYFTVTFYEKASPETRKHLAEKCGIDIIPFAEAEKMWPPAAA